LVKNSLVRIISLVVVNVLILIPGLIVWNYFKPGFFDRLTFRSEFSSAFPGVLNLHPVDKEKLIPGFMLPDDYQYRLYDSDATINIWFNSIYNRPLARGYFDPPIRQKERSYLFLTDSALSTDEGEPQLCSSFGFPEDLAYNNALFSLIGRRLNFWDYLTRIVPMSHLQPEFWHQPILKTISQQNFLRIIKSQNQLK